MSEPPKGVRRTPSNPGTLPAAPPRTQSQPGMRALQTAARAEPLQPAKPEGPIAARLKEGATDTALNVLGLLRDLLTDFRNSDQFFKYKALIVFSWVTLSVTSVFIACPGGTEVDNGIGARVVATKVLDTPVFMVVNDSGEVWKNIEVVVNGTWRMNLDRVPAHPPDNNVTVEPSKLVDAKGQRAPADLRVTTLSIRTSEGGADLVEAGRPVE